MTGLLIPLHGLGSRQDLPLPLPAAVVGAVVVLLASFAVLALAWRTPRWDGRPSGVPLPRLTAVLDAAATRWTVRAIGLFAFVWVGAALWFGQDLVTNPTFGFVFVWIWVGLVPLSLLFGPVWRTLNPLRTLADLCFRAGLPADGLLGSRTMAPAGRLPAAAALVGFAWLELVQPDNNTLAVIRWWWLAWLAFVLGGTVLLGRRWLDASDPFENYALLVARASPWQRIAGRITLVNPLRQLATYRPSPGSWALVCALLGSTAFDGFTGTSWWVRTVQTSSVPPIVWSTAGLLGMVALVAVTFVAGVRGIGRLRRGRLPDALAPSVTPIVIGYAVAHYLSLLILEGQRTMINLSDPLGLGWNVFGTAELGINQLWLGTPQVTAGIQLAAIVGGHVLGVLVAHELCLLRLPADRRITGQLPLLAVMIGYTCGGLLLLFSP